MSWCKVDVDLVRTFHLILLQEKNQHVIVELIWWGYVDEVLATKPLSVFMKPIAYSIQKVF